MFNVGDIVTPNKIRDSFGLINIPNGYVSGASFFVLHNNVKYKFVL